MLESTISLFFQRGQWLARTPLNISGNAISRTFIIQIISQGFTREGRAIPINNSDLVFFQILQIAVSSELTSSLIAKKTLTKERNEGEECKLLYRNAMRVWAPPQDQAGWVGGRQSQGHIICFPQRAMLPNGGNIPQHLPLGWIWSSLKKLLCVQNLSKFGWVLPVTYKYVCPQTEEKQSQKTISGAEVMSGQLTLKASLDVTSPGSLPCDYVVLCNIPIITHLTI